MKKENNPTLNNITLGKRYHYNCNAKATLLYFLFVGLEEFRKLVKDSKSTCAPSPAGLFIAA